MVAFIVGLVYMWMNEMIVFIYYMMNYILRFIVPQNMYSKISL
jgi:hypothetical protein